MRRFFTLLFLLLSFLSQAQNGGQYFENNVVKIQYVSKTSATVTFSVTSKQNCTANYKIDYGIVIDASIGALQTVEYTIPITSITFKARAEPQTACINQPDLGWVEVVVAAVLPVKLISFTGVQRDGNVTLKWEVVNETVSKFEIEKSIDGRNFTTISTLNKVAGYGNKEYNTTDQINSITYYRLKMYDDYNRPEYSKIVTFRGKSAYKFKLYGNPASDKIVFAINSSSSEMIKLNMVDFQGKTILSKISAITTGENVINIPFGNISKGVYHIIISTKSETFNERVVIL